MDAPSWEILVRIMGQMAAGDKAAVFVLYEEFGAPIAATIRRLAGGMGTRLTAEEVDELVLEACIALIDASPSWDPNGGALPWTWAERRLRHIVAVRIGIHADSLDGRLERGLDIASDDAEATVEPPARDDDPLATLTVMAETNGEVREFLLALVEVATVRDQRIFLEVRIQSSLGDRAPADTVGRMIGMKPATVRQVVKRVTDRLARAGVAVAA